jgi:hypothetical protein
VVRAEDGGMASCRSERLSRWLLPEVASCLLSILVRCWGITFGDSRIVEAWLSALVYTVAILGVDLPVMARK